MNDELEKPDDDVMSHRFALFLLLQAVQTQAMKLGVASSVAAEWLGVKQLDAVRLERLAGVLGRYFPHGARVSNYEDEPDPILGRTALNCAYYDGDSSCTVSGGCSA